MSLSSDPGGIGGAWGLELEADLEGGARRANGRLKSLVKRLQTPAHPRGVPEAELRVASVVTLNPIF